MRITWAPLILIGITSCTTERSLELEDLGGPLVFDQHDTSVEIDSPLRAHLVLGSDTWVEGNSGSLTVSGAMPGSRTRRSKNLPAAWSSTRSRPDNSAGSRAACIACSWNATPA